MLSGGGGEVVEEIVEVDGTPSPFSKTVTFEDECVVGNPVVSTSSVGVGGQVPPLLVDGRDTVVVDTLPQQQPMIVGEQQPRGYITSEARIGQRQVDGYRGGCNGVMEEPLHMSAYRGGYGVARQSGVPAGTRQGKHLWRSVGMGSPLPTGV